MCNSIFIITNNYNMLSNNFDLGEPFDNIDTISIIVNNAYNNKQSYYSLLNKLNKHMFKCNVEIKLINSNGLIQFINSSFLNKDIYSKILNLSFIHENPIPINRDFFNKKNTLFIG